MIQSLKEDNQNRMYDAVFSERRKSNFNSFLEEQRKLEAMVLDHMESGELNLGANTSILAQSNLIDKLVVDEMMLDELTKKYFVEK